MNFLCSKDRYNINRSKPNLTQRIIRNTNICLLLVFILIFRWIGKSQPAENGIFINVYQSQNDTARLPELSYQNGYRKSIEGQTIEYHSAHADADKALIVRAKRDVGSISWESDTLKEIEGDYYNLIWIAGIEKSGWQQATPHKFDLSINGERWFEFKNLKDSTAAKWSIAGKNGSELSFHSTLADRFGDLFGYMILKIFKKDFNAGNPLILEVKGENAESPDWYMVFEYSFNFTPRLRVEPALLKTNSAQAQMIRLGLDNLCSGRSIEIIIPHREPVRERLNIGGNIFFLPVEKMKSTTTLPVVFSIDGKVKEQKNIELKPVTQREIYLLSYSHNDIGYTDLQPNIEKKQMKNLEDALRLIKQTNAYPADARYKWNMEVIWALESFMKNATEDQRCDVVDAVKNGRLGLNALYANVLTGLAGGVEMTHFTDYARKFSQEYSFPITTACVSDIPGFTWGIASVLAQSGVKYFSIAPNNGDRVGNIYEMGDKPFYWSSQSGEEKVLTWIAAAGYSSFHEGDLSKLGEEKIFKMMRKLDENNYPYDIVQLPYTIGGDNGTPDSALSDFVKRWNEKYDSPRLVISTHEQMFRNFEERYGSTLQTMKGDLTPYWEDGAFSTAKETFLNRHAADRLIQGEVLWSMRSPEKFPSSEYYDAWRQVILYDEHTWGAHNSITDPDSSFVKEQWEFKKEFALNADGMSQALLSKAFNGATSISNAMDVYNTSSWIRTDLILIPREQSTIGDLVSDEEGKKVASQRLSTGELVFMAEKIPPFSSKRYNLKKGRAFTKGDAKILGTTIENRFLSATIDGTTGAVDELVWKNKSMATANGSTGLNRYFYVSGKNSDSAQTLSNVHIKLTEHGPLVASLIIEADAAGCKKYSTEVRIISGIDRIDIINRLDKSAVREKEGVHFGFPFIVPDGQLRYDVGWGIVQPEKDQLPGACKNFFSVQNFVDISNIDFGVTWATPDASMIEVGAINAEKQWMKSIESSQTFYSYVMNNYWHTNYKADQEGPVTIRYSIMPHGKYLPEDAVRFGREQREPLIAIASGNKISPSLFTVEPPGVLVTSCKPISGGWHIQLYNATVKEQRVNIQWNKTTPVTQWVSDVYGNAFDEIKRGLVFPAFGSRYLRVTRK